MSPLLSDSPVRPLLLSNSVNKLLPFQRVRSDSYLRNVLTSNGYHWVVREENTGERTHAIKNFFETVPSVLPNFFVCRSEVVSTRCLLSRLSRVHCWETLWQIARHLRWLVWTVLRIGSTCSIWMNSWPIELHWKACRNNSCISSVSWIRVGFEDTSNSHRLLLFQRLSLFISVFLIRGSMWVCSCLLRLVSLVLFARGFTFQRAMVA